MLVFGIDVLVLAMCAMACVCISFIASCVLGLSRDEGIASMTSTTLAVIAMLVCYVVMAMVLDGVLGPFGW